MELAEALEGSRLNVTEVLTEIAVMMTYIDTRRGRLPRMAFVGAAIPELDGELQGLVRSLVDYMYDEVVDGSNEVQIPAWLAIEKGLE